MTKFTLNEKVRAKKGVFGEGWEGIIDAFDEGLLRRKTRYHVRNFEGTFAVWFYEDELEQIK